MTHWSYNNTRGALTRARAPAIRAATLLGVSRSTSHALRLLCALPLASCPASPDDASDASATSETTGDLATTSADAMTTDGSTEEVVSLAIPSAWTPSAPADDPFLDERPADVACATGWGEEGGLFEVNTDACAYGAFTQPSLASIEPGDAIELVLVHDALAADAPATAHVALAIGDAIAWTESIAIPGEADILRPQWVADEVQPVGAPLHFHVHNHGANSYRLVALTRTRAP